MLLTGAIPLAIGAALMTMAALEDGTAVSLTGATLTDDGEATMLSTGATEVVKLVGTGVVLLGITALEIVQGQSVIVRVVASVTE